MNDQPVTASWASDHHLRLLFGPHTNASTLKRVHHATRRLARAALPGLLDTTPAYATVLLDFDIGTLEPAATLARVLAALEGLSDDTDPANHTPTSRLVEIPVCYEGEFAPDIADVAAHCRLSPAEVARTHADAEYTVAFIGFSPGFGYLSGLPTPLITPRLSQPRLRVAPGSVGIAANQTGIYPHATSGGWRLIGRTPLAMFDAAQPRPSRLTMGDRVRFVPISPDRFDAIASTSKGAI